jgi:hypothetical protein
MKQRSYNYVTGNSTTGYQVQKVNIESEDLYDKGSLHLPFISVNCITPTKY